MRPGHVQPDFLWSIDQSKSAHALSVGSTAISGIRLIVVASWISSALESISVVKRNVPVTVAVDTGIQIHQQARGLVS